VPATARAQPAADDGYCDYVEGAATATAAPLYGPQLFGQFGYLEQPAFAVEPAADSSNLRAIAGVRWSATSAYAGSQTAAKAGADCRRHRALLDVRGASLARALAARVHVLDDAQQEADRIGAEAIADLEGRRATAQDATATRLRVEELRSLALDARRQLATLPAPEEHSLTGVMATFHAADTDLEAADGKLRTAQAYQLDVRFGVDQFLEGPNTATEGFAVVEVGVNLGALWLGHGNARAAAGRAKYARSGHDPLGADATVEQMRALIDVEGKRAEQTSALVGDLDRQLAALGKLGGDDARRYRETVWFDWIKAKADLAFLQAHVAALREVVGSEP
jgi:hypothetical protein